MRQLLRLVFGTMLFTAIFMASAVLAMRIAIHGREVRVPDLIGMTQEQAERIAAGNELQVSVENRFYSESVATGKVLTQAPPPGEKVRRGQSVRLALSLGAQRSAVPDVRAVSARVAEIELRRFGFQPSHVSELPSPIEAGTVLSQAPQANAASAESPLVNLLVAAPAEEPAWVMPEVHGLTVEEALRRLAPAGASVDVITMPSEATAASGTVYEQSPDAGSKLTRGSSVRLTAAP